MSVTTDVQAEDARPPSRLGEALRRADAFFLSEAQRSQSAQEIAYTRTGIVICLVASLGVLCFLPYQHRIWPGPATAVNAALALGSLSLPFLLRRRPGIRWVGLLVTGYLAALAGSAIFMSGGRATGVLPFLPMLPILALLARGGRAALACAAGALGLSLLGLGLLAAGAEPAPAFRGTTPQSQYAIALICTAGLGLVALIFERFWNRTAIEVADRARTRLREREERNRLLLDHASEGVMLVDGDGFVKFASPAAERLLAAAPGEAVGHRLRDFTAPDDYVRTLPAWTRVLATPGGVGHVRLTTRPGIGEGDPSETRYLQVTIANHLDNPAVAAIVVRMLDLTELAQAEANFQAVVEHSIQGIAVECEGRIVYANQALADLFAISVSELHEHVERPIAYRYVHEDDQERIRQAYAGPPDGVSDVMEMRFLCGDGQWRWIQFRWSQISWEGRPARVIVYADITAQKQLLERQEREHERLEAAIAERTRELEESQRSLREQERMAAVGTLAAGIAHQINNPIGAILTTADFALLTADEPDGERNCHEALEDIRAQAIRCGKIVRSVLHFSRAADAEKWSCDLAGVLRTAVDVTTRFAREHEAEISLAMGADTQSRSVSMNPIEIEQVFVNLIRNAIESRPRGVRVAIRTRRIGKEIEVTVEDDGPGIPESVVPHVFEPFYTTRLREGGTGLGLSVAHGIVVDHGGSMQLDPTPEGEAGARFRIRLPLDDEQAPPA